MHTHPNPVPVVLDLQKLQPACLDKNRDGGCASIKAIFHHLFQSGSRAMDDLASRNAVHNHLVKLVDGRHTALCVALCSDVIALITRHPIDTVDRSDTHLQAYTVVVSMSPCVRAVKGRGPWD